MQKIESTVIHLRKTFLVNKIKNEPETYHYQRPEKEKEQTDDSDSETENFEFADLIPDTNIFDNPLLCANIVIKPTKRVFLQVII